MALIHATVVTSQREGVRAVDTIKLTVLATAAANHQLTVCGEWLWLKDRQLVSMIRTKRVPPAEPCQTRQDGIGVQRKAAV